MNDSDEVKIERISDALVDKLHMNQDEALAAAVIALETLANPVYPSDYGPCFRCGVGPSKHCVSSDYKLGRYLPVPHGSREPDWGTG